MEVFAAVLTRNARQPGLAPRQRDENCLDSWQSAGHKLAAEGKPVYRVLAEHQTSETWGYQELVQELRRWAGIFDFEFKL